ncbi:uncharacterized protein LOC129573530 [Sitodiplosis mosellana]|uniref:uncharacterized protein LOC129573530 n=1 Tax=Sitodiplosis mosellana TaxID=263140 RepID=UPI002444A1E9|nr:uncharacterized protein LOC129573530 [Sitodiplosis mosellana]XP_055310108.1 uncharacterized protein LOC129573530 [Sitodiplosis mosellana]XP_055310109.1 uncharacterized protein LOC129573530 [Sitodiplosis mosellana]XP_055310110.1 uncharacterized protein LOC129573530 [Sitodiplosis mosellana]XP_055310112.1 uncharacterized protein LOC129573530 [Sitodiplosis mosellana]XP_055310113.1 uncharacterized protein LOC129573530 [Sitodiplosis mosellana]
MKAFAILLCMYMVSLASSLPIISKPLEDNPDHLVWEALLTIDTHRPDDKTRKIPKSIFITPNLNESKGNCAPDHKLGPDGRCYKTLQIDPLQMLKKQIESLLKNNRTATTEYEDDYDYSEYGESTESMNANGQYTVPLSLGFSGDNRIPQQTQQTTFPNLNRVVKDDSHVSPIVPSTTVAATAAPTTEGSTTAATTTTTTSTTTITVATSTSTTSADTDNREVNQPFRASTTGIDLGSEGVNVESKLNPIASVSTTSGTAPSSTTAYTVDTTSSQSSSTHNNQVHGQNSNPSESSMATITFESLIDENPSSMQVSSSIRSVSSTEIPDASTENASSSVKSFLIEDDNASSTEQIETVTSSVDSSERFEKNTDAGVSLTPTVENVEAPETNSMASSTESQETELTGQSSNVEAESTQATTKTSIETQDKLNLPVSSASETQPKITPNTDNAQLIEQKPNQHVIFDEEFEHKSITEPSVKSMNLKLAPELSTEQPDIKLVTESSTIPVPTQKPIESSSTTSDEGLLPEKNDSFEVVDAYFIPSPETPEEIDPAVGKNINVSIVEPRYRMENASVISDDELPEAELAPVIDTGIDGRLNIDELVKSSDGSIRAQFEDEKKNLSTRLAEELLFQGPSVEFNDRDSVPTKPVRQFNVPVVKSESAESIGKNFDFEEALSGGVPIGSGANLGSDSTTEEPLDYDSIRSQTASISPEIVRNVDYEGPLPVKEAVPFNREPVSFRSEQHFFQQQPPLPPLPPPHAQPSIYSTFISRLKVAPPFVELHDQHPETVQYSHTPFDIASSFQNVSPNRRFGTFDAASASVTTHPTFTLPDADRSLEVDQPTPVRAKSLQIGINCYVKNLDKQQYIICDDA